MDPLQGVRPGFKVVRTDRELEMGDVDEALRRAGGHVVLLPDGTPQATLEQEVADADLLLMCYAHIGASVIAAAPRLKAIVKYGVGIDAIDMVAARAAGLPVVNVPAYAEDTVAEGAFMLMMGLFKRTRAIQRAMDTAGWAWPQPTWLAADLAGKTLGLVGCGRIGRSMARMAAGFRMRVLAVDPHLASEYWPLEVERCPSLHAMLPRCDAVSVHCVLDTQTRHLIGADELARFPRGAILVNVSRGEIVDEAAMVRALLQGHLGGVGLDVYGQEPLSRSGHPLSALFGRDDAILWPHLSFYTREAMQRLSQQTLARCGEALRGEPLTVHSADPRLRAQSRGVWFAST